MEKDELYIAKATKTAMGSGSDKLLIFPFHEPTLPDLHQHPDEYIEVPYEDIGFISPQQPSFNVWPSVRIAKQDHPMSSFQDYSLSQPYLHIIQQILSEITTNLHQKPIAFHTNHHRFIHPHRLKQPEVQAINKHLLLLLHKVDEHFNERLNEINRVKSAFHGFITELDPASFALHTFFLFYRNLRKALCNQILVTHQIIDLHTKQSDQQRRGKAQQPWKQHRGLPQKSICVLRQWLFHNFLRPYPNDSEKQLLARKSGLTKSQVSNWFINARVRLWKPMVEEMYLETNTIRSRT